MSNKLTPIKLDSYQPLREVVFETLRDAIRKGIMMPRRGTYVSNLSIKDINEVFEIRTSLDSLASGLAAERITDEELEHLQRLLVVIGEAIKEKNMEKIVEADTKFHDILYQASRNNRLEETLEEHRRIVDTIAQGDAVAAQKASEYHMERSEHTLLLSMEDKDGNM